mgnify:CR=1 FL=1
MDRNQEICNNAMQYSFSTYLRPGETQEDMIKRHCDIITAVNFLRNRGISSPNVANLGTIKVKNSNFNSTGVTSKSTTQNTLF